MRDHVHLFINGRPVDVHGDDVFLTLSDFLRKKQRLTGTKVVCAEGDCGSCAVLIGRLCDDDRIHYSSVTSCIQLMLQLDAAHVVTVEGLRGEAELNPIQQAMVSCQGTQCGFCTPGFVVSLYDLMGDGKKVDAHAVRRALVGNLCRCTGYESIVKAALDADRSALKSVDAIYPPDPIVETLKRAASEEVRIETATRKFYKPTNLDAAVRYRAEHPESAVISGATDLGVVYNKRMREINVALSLGGLASFKAVKADADSMYIGAAASLTTLEQTALQHLPELGRYLAWFGSPLIKNAGTIAGNLVTGSPIGDTLPPLMALEAEIDIVGTSGARRVSISKFYTGYRKTVLGPDELVTGVRIPLLKADEMLKLYKVSRRKDLDISSFSAAIWIRQANGAIDDVRIFFGGVGPMVMRMTGAETILRGKPPALGRFEDAGASARDQVTPITDVRGSDRYRRTLAANIFSKFWHDVFAADSGGTSNNGNGNGHPGPLGQQPRTIAAEPAVAP